MFGVDDAFMIMGAMGLINGIGALASSPQEEATKKILGKLNGNEGWLKETPFSKEEIMNVLLPQVQKMYRGASDVAAGRIGSALGEGGIAGGQAFSEYYTQALAPVIAAGENKAAGAVSEFGKWFSALDSQAKNRFLSSIQMELSGNKDLPSMDEFQRLISGVTSGLGVGANMAGNVASMEANVAKANWLNNSDCSALDKTMGLC